MEQRKIQFSPPDITEEEIQAVCDTLRSGWITAGPKTKQFEKEIAEYCGVLHAICLNSATAGLELVLRLFQIGEGDEVITTPLTFAASANFASASSSVSPRVRSLSICSPAILPIAASCISAASP